MCFLITFLLYTERPKNTTPITKIYGFRFATDKEFEANRKERHNRDAKFGWYRYISRFALPVFDENGEIERYNVFHVSLLIRHAADEKMYLYDIMAIKKETSTPFQSEDFTK